MTTAAEQRVPYALEPDLVAELTDAPLRLLEDHAALLLTSASQKVSPAAGGLSHADLRKLTQQTAAVTLPLAISAPFLPMTDAEGVQRLELPLRGAWGTYDRIVGYPGTPDTFPLVLALRERATLGTVVLGPEHLSAAEALVHAVKDALDLGIRNGQDRIAAHLFDDIRSPRTSGQAGNDSY